jgi:hypothetical protein
MFTDLLYFYVFGHYLCHDSDFYTIVILPCVDNTTLAWKSEDWAPL